jgi:DNA-binding transcriptional regulator YiaG
MRDGTGVRANNWSGQRIRTIRRALDMTHVEFAFYLGVSVGTLSRWENGKAVPSRLAELSLRNLCVEHRFDLHTMRPF